MSRLTPLIQVELPSGSGVTVMRRRYRGGAGDGPRVAIVAGIRGDAPEGIRVAHEVAGFLEIHEEKFRGIVDVYPCVNPLAAHRGSRVWPFFDVDLNRLFPGKEHGHPPDRVAHALTADVQGADQVIELRGARPAFREATQAIVRAEDAAAAELAMNANVAVVWRRTPGPAAPVTFAHQFPGTVVLEGGTGNRLTAGIGQDLADGVLHMLSILGVLAESDLPFHWAGMQRPLQVTDDQVVRVRTNSGGLFLPSGVPGAEVELGAMLGEVVDPASGATLEQVVAPATGQMLAVREHPVVFPGSMVARVVVKEGT